MEAVKLYGTKNWSQVSVCMTQRSAAQCQFRWTKGIDPKIKKVPWSKEEDERLNLAIEAYAEPNCPNWSLVCNHVPGRADTQCRERFTGVLTPNKNTNPWTEEEDECLLEAVDRIGAGAWSEVAKAVGGNRTDNRCMRRWSQLDRPAMDARRLKVTAMKSILPGNHQGQRHNEKTQVSAEDLTGSPNNIELNQSVQVQMPLGMMVRAHLRLKTLVSAEQGGACAEGSRATHRVQDCQYVYDKLQYFKPVFLNEEVFAFWAKHHVDTAQPTVDREPDIALGDSNNSVVDVLDVVAIVPVADEATAANPGLRKSTRRARSTQLEGLADEGQPAKRGRR